MVEVRKAKELNDRLDLEIRALRSRVRSLDAERNSLQQTVRYDDGQITLCSRISFLQLFAAKTFEFK